MDTNAQDINDNDNAVGLDGYFTLLLSNLALIITAGLYWLWLIKVVYQYAKNASTDAQNCDMIAVLGIRPDNNQIKREFQIRLNRAVTLFEQGYANRVLVIGGTTGNNTLSEADLGVQYLLRKGLSRNHLLTEDHSRHTLENLHNIKELFLHGQGRTAALVTSRYHLARCHRMANALRIAHRLCAAENDFNLDLTTAINIVKEAYFIHWYEIGKLWAYSVNNKKSLSRIR